MSDLKTAQELKAIADSHSRSSVIVQNIITAASAAANEGEYCINYDTDGFQYHVLDDIRKEVIEKLDKLGYSCYHQRYGYEYGGCSDLLVSWK
jgi:hypothetical protein